jgi:hypothetical protein
MTLPVHKSATRARARAGWQLLVALFAALSFVLLVSTAATHRHADAVSSHDCAVCSVVADKIAGTPAAPVLVQIVQLQPYLLFIVAASVAAYASPRLLPPACGPPAASVSSLG